MKTLLIGLMILSSTVFAGETQTPGFKDLLSKKVTIESACELMKKDVNECMDLINGGVHCKQCPAESEHCIPRACPKSLYE